MIEIGEYVRTIDGYIRKVTQVNKKGSYEGICYGAYSVDKRYKNSVGISAKKILKHSKKIIDLIEEGDFLEILADGELFRFEVDSIDYKHKLKNIGENIKVKSIVTKEQYKQIEYIVEE